MLAKSYPYYLANKPVFANEDLRVDDKYTGEEATRVALADEKIIDQAISAAVTATPKMRKLAALY